jgi:hypothetical protein
LTWPPAQLPPIQTAPARPARRGGRLVLLTSGLLIILLALAIVPLLRNGADDGQSGTAEGTPTTPASPEQYQTALTSLDNAVATGMREISAARTPATVRNATDALAVAVQSETDKLREITPPRQVATAHDGLVGALEGFSAAISAGSTENVCSGSSATSWMSRQTAANALRAAAGALGTADPAHSYKVGTSLPKAAEDASRRLDNGRYLKRTSSSGIGQMKIKNGGGSDGVVSIVPSNAKQPAVVVYLRGRQSFTVRGVSDGTYRIYVSTGTDWDSRAKTFSRTCAFDRFDDSFTFSTTSTSYTVWEITLQAVSDGNATATTVGADEFPIG